MYEKSKNIAATTSVVSNRLCKNMYKDWLNDVFNLIIIIIIIIFIRSWQTATNYKNKLIDQSINAFVQHSENEISLSSLILVFFTI